jgi:hypothetical protein
MLLMSGMQPEAVEERVGWIGMVEPVGPPRARQEPHLKQAAEVEMVLVRMQ